MSQSLSYCMNCGRELTKGRYDKHFCNKRCSAAWHRSRTPDWSHDAKRPGEVHEEKARQSQKNCENCGNHFWYNTYAERGGERIPQYCSNRCRQAAYRARKAAPAQKQNDQQQRQQRQQQNDQDKQRKQQQNDQQQRQQRQQQQQRRSWWEWLNVSNSAGWDAAHTAWKKLVNEWHPDRNSHRAKEAEEMLKNINNAHDEAKKYYGKNVRQARH